ncbi:MAG: response regulator [Gammaproteobacteria bacterium]|nr:response regulator [Gammaproteobacteria bacterium]
MEGNFINHENRKDGADSAPPRLDQSEYRQAIIRLSIGSVLLIGFLLLAFWSSIEAIPGVTVAIVAALIILVPLALLISITRRPEQYPGRIYSSLVFDVSSVTAVLYFGDGISFPLCIVFSWIVYDYGKHFGTRFLFPAAAASFISISTLLLISDFWQANTSLGLVILCLIGLLPVYLKSAVTGKTANVEAPESSKEILQAMGAANKEEYQPLNQTDDQSSLSDKKILIVSSDTEDRHGIQHQLALWGAQATLSNNAAYAFYKLIMASKKGNPYHIVIVDHGRLGIDDAQFATAIRSEPTLQSLYLIHVGSDQHRKQQDRLLNAGFTKLLSTPLNKTFLFNAMHNTYTQHEADGQVVRLIDRYSSNTSDQPLSILVADSSFNARQHVRSILQRAGHRVFMVNNGARVLDALDSHRFDLALVSLDLTEITGLEAFKLYRFTRVDKQCVPFILLLEEHTNELLKRCSEAGIKATIDRNADSRKYLETVSRVARENSEETSLDFSVNSLRSTTIGDTKSNDEGVLDINRLMEIERLGGGTHFLSDLIDSFNRDNRRILIQMQEVVKGADPNCFRDLGHALKDAAGSLGTLKLFQLGTAASRLSDKDFDEYATTLVQEITECCRISNNALHTYLLGQIPSENDS